MTHARPFHLLGRSQLDQIEQDAHFALRSLIGRWWPKSTNFEVSAKALDDNIQPARTPVRCVLGADDVQMAVLGSEREWLAPFQYWLGCKPVSGSPLTHWLERRFFTELFIALAGKESVSEEEHQFCSENITATYGLPGAGTVVLDLVLGDATHTLLTTASMWRALDTTQQTPRVELELSEVASALGACQMTFDAVLPNVDMALIEVANLAVGDFVNLQHDLSGRLSLIGRNTNIVLPAFLGQKNGFKATSLSETEHGKKYAS